MPQGSAKIQQKRGLRVSFYRAAGQITSFLNDFMRPFFPHV
jgi:hypothetical protein